MVENDVVEIRVYDELVRNVNAIQTNDACNLDRKIDYGSKVKEVKYPTIINTLLHRN